MFGIKLGRLKSATDTQNLSQLIDLLNLSGSSKGKLSEVTYFSCLKILSESLGKLPLKLLQKTTSGGIVKAVDHPLYYLVNQRPNPYMTSTTFWGAMEYNRNHYGNAYAWIKSKMGTPTSLWAISPDQVEVWWDDGRILADTTDVWYIYTDTITGKRYKLPSAEILHLHTSSCVDGLVGKSVKEILSDTLDGNLTAQRMLNRFYENGFTAKAVVHYTGNINDTNEKAFLKGIEDFATGKVNGIQNFIPAPLGVTIQPLDIKLTDAQFLELKRYSALQIAAAMGIKPNQINDYEKSSYASAEAQQLDFYVTTLLYILKQYEEELNYKLLTDAERKAFLFFKFNVNVILRADLKTQMDSLARAVAGGIYTPNEARENLDLPHKEGGDQLLVNGSSIPVYLAGAQYTGKGGEEGE